jgi:hypothetical protein
MWLVLWYLFSSPTSDASKAVGGIGIRFVGGQTTSGDLSSIVFTVAVASGKRADDGVIPGEPLFETEVSFWCSS